MVHGLIGIVLRRAAPLKLLNYKLTRRSRWTASVIRFATLESRLPRFSRPLARSCPLPLPRATIDFPPDLARPPRLFFFHSFLFIILPLQIKFRFIARETNNIIDSNTNERIKFARASLVFVHHSRSSPRSGNETDRYVFRKKRGLKKTKLSMFSRDNEAFIAVAASHHFGHHGCPSILINY